MAYPSSSDTKTCLLSIDDLDVSDIERILELSGRFASGVTPTLRCFSIALLFLTPSLRTRTSFAVAASRLGGAPIAIDTLRLEAGMSTAESLGDSLRVLTGLVDVVALRTPEALDHDGVRALAHSPVVNGGDGRVDHPTQTLIDLFAMNRHCGAIGNLRIGICGDLQTRSVRSLLRLFRRMPPAALRLISPIGRDGHGIDLGCISYAVEKTHIVHFEDLDVLYMAGLPEGSGDTKLTADQRSAYGLTEEKLKRLPADVTILSPLPLIDEVTDAVRSDRRFKAYQQSDDGVWVRMAVLSRLLSFEPSSRVHR
jgi:aspartate carbamoyltransferase catalytic subunit